MCPTKQYNLTLVKTITKKLWSSPIIMSWGSIVARLLTFILILPLALAKLSTAEVALWLLFGVISGLQVLADIGFSSTFARIIAYALGGASTKNLKDYRTLNFEHNNGKPDWLAVGAIVSTMKAIYKRLSFMYFSLVAVFGTWAVAGPISSVENPMAAWLSWATILLFTVIAFRTTLYSAYLQGINEIAVLRRWEMLTTLGLVTTGLLALLVFENLLCLIIVQQSWILISYFRNRWLCRTLGNKKFDTFLGSSADNDVFSATWPSAWRSGLGVLMGFGVIQMSGIIYAQVAKPAEVASYLLALRIIQVVSSLSQAPFYSKLPILAKLRSVGNLPQQILIAKQGMRLSYWTFVIVFVGIGLFSELLLKIIQSNVQFPNPMLWSLLGMAIFTERYGAMHLQLYSITNHIVWHVANGVSGVLFIVSSVILFKYIGVYSFPMAMLIGYIGFYIWYATQHSYRAFNLKFWGFEKTTMLPPLGLMIIYLIGSSMFIAR